MSDTPCLRVRRRKVANVFKGDPWIYPNACCEPLPPAGVAQVRTDDEQALGWADVNPVAPIPGRLLTRADTWPGEEAWLRQAIGAALSRREALGYQLAGGGVRLINNEGDGLPGLAVDAFGRHLVVDLGTRGMAERLPLIRRVLAEHRPDSRITIRISDDAARREGIDPQAPTGSQLEFAEAGVVYQVMLASGQKTGFFLDQRDNRRLIAGWAPGRRMLDLFCYHGAFALAALGGGAASALAIDASRPALEQAERNAERNGFVLATRSGDIFDLLGQDRLADDGPFDLIVCDPPKLAPRRRDQPRALKAYRFLIERCCRLLAEQGILLVASCSHAIDADDLLELLRSVAAKRRLELDVLAVTGQPSDHPWPVGFATGRYLSAVSVMRR